VIKIKVNRLNKYRTGLLGKYLLIITIGACYVLYGNFADTEAFSLPKNSNQEYTGLMKFCNDTTINILESKKSGNWIFSKYRKNTLTGLAAIYRDSIVFINDTFFAHGIAEYQHQQFTFVDSLKIEFTASRNFDGKTVNHKYLFRFDEFSNKWLLEYAEEKESGAGQSFYRFTDDIRIDISTENFSAEKSPSALFSNVNEGLFVYKYKNKSYLDSIEIQVNNMRLSKATSFKKIFTVDHVEEILHDYPVNKTTVLSLNNIAYYLEQMSITMPAIAILETVIDNYPDRTVSYLNLSDALRKNNLTVKAEKMYQRYSKLLKTKKK
jgi:hypothetical protein